MRFSWCVSACTHACVRACVLTRVRTRGLRAGPGSLFIQRIARPGDVYSSIFMLLPGSGSSGDFGTSNWGPPPPMPRFCSLRLLEVSVGGVQRDSCSPRDLVLLSSSLLFTSTSDARAAVQPPGRSSHPHEEATLRVYLALVPPLLLASSLRLRKNWGLF